jgi:hypothetical protein
MHVDIVLCDLFLWNASVCALDAILLKKPFVFRILKQHNVTNYSELTIAKEIGYSFFFAQDPGKNYIAFSQQLNQPIPEII